ncbi:glycoside hydrolase family 78 protein [Pararhodonellum marinum]|uniref:glycoside hydrolase family 78 protein n=1 Tax=Pararhodonellum marinum TaxID=2755358 RepID=UPI00188FE3BD|nr:glycoside hydrolase family 78 protein [Pararhodonellum marinum]
MAYTFHVLLTISLALAFDYPVSNESFPQAVKLKCDNRINPINIDIEAPLLSWQVGDKRRGAAQTAYQILVADDSSLLDREEGNMWNSGKVSSSQSIHIPYKGEPLHSNKKYFWKVKIWDHLSQPAEWSEVHYWETSLMDYGEWQAAWIGLDLNQNDKDPTYIANWIWHPDETSVWKMMYFEKAFETEAKQISTAFIDVTADNAYELFLNGSSLGSHREWTPLQGTRFFRYDLKELVTKGLNKVRIAAVRTKEERKAGTMAQIEITYTDGTKSILLTDNSWDVYEANAFGWLPNKESDSKPVKAAVVEKYGGEHWGKTKAPYKGPRSILVRKEDVLQKTISKAKVYVTGLGGFYLYVNGKKIGNDVLAPGWTHYRKRVQYQTYDVTEALKSGTNCFAAQLGNLWWSGDVGYRGLPQFSEGPLRFIMQLHVTYEDGTSEIFKTDETWKAHLSPILANSIYDGETYDARLEVDGWNLPGLNDSDWLQVEELKESKDKLLADQLEPIQITRTIKPVSVKEIEPGKYIFDMGQNMAGWVKLKVNGPEGTEVTLRFAEILKEDGSLNTEPLRTAKATDRYIPKGEGQEEWEPAFTYHGFQFVEVTGFPGTPTRESITGKVFHTNAPVIGQIETSNEMLNQLVQNIYWSQIGNMHSVVTDCPQRDERLGWTGDAQIFAATAFYNMDMSLMFRKYLRDIRDSQMPDGEVTDYAPHAFSTYGAGPGWADAIVIVPWKTFLFHGDTTIISENFDNMLAWHKTLMAKSEKNLLELGGFGDWVAVEQTPSEPIGSAYYFYSTKLLAQMAEVLDKKDEAERLYELSEKIRIAFNEKHLNKDKQYWADTQTAHVLPLSFGIAPLEDTPEIIENLTDNIYARDVQVTTGFLGTQYILPVLSQNNHHELAYQLVDKRSYPSWGYMIAQGATTIWELWNSDKQGAEMNSRNHYAYGTVGEWLYAYLGGIRINENSPGFKKFDIAPLPAGDLEWVKTSYDSPYGKITSNWIKKDSQFIVEVTVPANTTGTVSIPTKNLDELREAGEPVSENPDFSNFVFNDGLAQFEVKSGSYIFTSKLY